MCSALEITSPWPRCRRHTQKTSYTDLNVLHPLQDGGTLNNVTFQGRAGGSQTPALQHSVAKSLVGSDYDSTPASTVVGHALTDLHAAHEDLDGLSPASVLGHAPVSTDGGSIGELTA